MANLLKEHSKPVAQSIVGSLIFWLVLSGGSAMIAWYSAHSAYLQGLALHWVILLGVGIFLMIAISINLISLTITRHRKQRKEPQDESAKAVAERNFEKEKDSLQRKHGTEIQGRENTIRTLNQKIETLKDQINALNQYGLVHKEADKQAEDIGKCVEVIESYFCYQELDNPMLKVVFGLDIRNRSFFEIVIENKLGGHIRFVGTELTERPLIINPPIEASSMREEIITIEQRLTRAEAELIRSKLENPDFADFDFGGLTLTIKGSNRFPNVKPQPLTIPRKWQIVKVNQFKIDIDNLRSEFKAERKSLISELNTLTRNHEADTNALERRHEGVLSMMDDRYEAHVKKLKAEIDLLKTQLDERYNPKLKFELYRLIDSKVYLFHIVNTLDPPEIEPVERDYYNINSYFHVNLIKEDNAPQILKDIKASLFRITRNGKGKEKEIPADLAYMDIHTPEGFASEGRINIRAGIVLSEVGITPRHFEGNIQIKTEYGKRLNKNCFLRFTLIASNQYHYSADIYVDWDEARTDGGTKLLSPKNSVQYRVHRLIE